MVLFQVEVANLSVKHNLGNDALCFLIWEYHSCAIRAL